MKFEELIVLLPCHSLEDFPVHLVGPEAESILAAWSALWHPQLLASAGRAPSWFRADGPPDNLAGRLVLIPTASEELLETGWAARAAEQGARLVRKQTSRAPMLAAALEGFEPSCELVGQMAPDFLALGTCYLFVELLTRQMRYMSNIDETQLHNAALAAAQAACTGDRDETERYLRQAFDVLLEARERFYPVDAYLIDLTLVAPTTLGPALLAELGTDAPTNLLLSGHTLDELARTAPLALAALRQALDHRTVDLIGGEYEEGPLPLEPEEAKLANFRRGLATFEEHLKLRPSVYGRRRFGLSPELPGLLSSLGYQGALHFTLDDGRFPPGQQAKVRWEGWDLAAIDTLCKLPLDAAEHESMLGFPRQMGDSMDLDRVATVVFAHWPGNVSDAYRDLRRMALWGSPLGKFITLADYFSQTDRPGELTKFPADRYRSPYLRQAIIREHQDPVSSIAKLHQQKAETQAADTLGALATLVTGRSGEGEPAQRLASAVGARAAAERGSLILLNPSSFARRRLVDVSTVAPLAETSAVISVAEQEGKTSALVEVPACGFAWLSPRGDAPAPAPKAKGLFARSTPPRLLAEGLELRNEFFEVMIHPETGGIRSIFAPGQRRNRLSQQLACRQSGARPQPGDLWRDPDETAQYSVMAVDKIDVLEATPISGKIRTQGRLCAIDGRRLAGYTQTVSVVAGSRVIGLDIELDVAEPPRADPWNSYYAARFAWADPTVELQRGAGLRLQPGGGKRVETPHYIRIGEHDVHATILTGGLPFHTRVGDRMLDSILVLKREQAHSFRLGIGIDLAHPAQAALDLLTPMPQLTGYAPAPLSPATGWLLHVDAPNVVLTHLAPLGEEQGGFRARLLETEGLGGRVHLRTFRTPRQAWQVDFTGRRLVELAIENDAIGVDVSPFDWIQIEALW